MNGKSDFRFEFEGEVSPRRDERERASESEVYEHLQRDSFEIGHDIELSLRDEIREAVGIDVRVDARIYFSRGSVFFTGAITVLGVMAMFGGALSFLQIVSRAIRRVLRRVLSRRVPGWRVVAYVDVPYLPPVVAGPSGSELSSPPQLFSLRTILVAITLLNAVIFVGGSVYTGVSVNSIQEKYQEAAQEIKRTRDEYEDFRADLQESVGDIEGQLQDTASQTVELGERAESLSTTLAELEQDAAQFRDMLEAQRNTHSGWVSLWLVFDQANWLLRGLLSLVFLSSISALVVTGLVLKSRIS